MVSWVRGRDCWVYDGVWEASFNVVGMITKEEF